MTQVNSTDSKALVFSHLLVLFCCIALIITYTCINFFIQAETSNSFWLMKVIPLALFIPGLLAKKLRAYQWLCFLIMIYFIQAILDIFSADRRVQGILETVLISLLYSAAIHFTHGKLKHLKQKMKQAPFKKEQE